MKEYKTGDCDSCGTENVMVIRTDSPRFNDEEEHHLCEICYTTHASKPYFYPRNSVGLGEIITIIAQIGNIIRKDIAKINLTNENNGK